MSTTVRVWSVISVMTIASIGFIVAGLTLDTSAGRAVVLVICGIGGLVAAGVMTYGWFRDVKGKM